MSLLTLLIIKYRSVSQFPQKYSIKQQKLFSTFIVNNKKCFLNIKYSTILQWFLKEFQAENSALTP